MKIATKRRGLLVMAMVVAAIVTVAVAQWVSAGTPEAEEIMGKSMDVLAEQGVPVKFWSLEGATLSVSLQSASVTDVGTPEDPIYLSQVQREAFLAKSRGVDLSLLKLDMANAEGKPLFVGEIVLNQVLDAAWSKASGLSEVAAVTALSQKLAEKADLSSLALGPLTIDLDRGVREISIEATAADVLSASASTTSLMISLYCAVNDLNESQGAQIAVVRVDIADKAGQPLLKWIYDVQRGAQNWWQAPGMTTDWFESPPPVSQTDGSASVD